MIHSFMPCLLPVLHEADLPFSGDLFCRALGGEGGGGRHYYTGGYGAGRGCSDLIGLDITRGSYRTKAAQNLTQILPVNALLACLVTKCNTKYQTKKPIL